MAESVHVTNYKKRICTFVSQQSLRQLPCETKPTNAHHYVSIHDLTSKNAWEILSHLCRTMYIYWMIKTISTIS